MTFAATLTPVVYEGGIPVFIDTERDSWNMQCWSNGDYLTSNLNMS